MSGQTSISHVRWVRTESLEGNAVLAYAGRELARYVRRLVGSTWDVRGVGEVRERPRAAWLGICDRMPAPPRGTLTPAPWDDGFVIWAVEDTLYISGRNARSVLYGVYAFLEMQGVRYLRPGYDGEVIPRLKALSLPDSPVYEGARYRHRGVCIEGAPSLAHALEMIDWCAKKRMNTVFLQFLSSRYFYSLWYERPYNPQFADESLSEQEALAYDDELIAAMKVRGLVLHRVGHGWTSAAFEMPRSGWVTAGEEVKPEYVRWVAEVGGERALFRDIPINTELCYSHQPAFDAFVETIVRYCEEHPELDVVHVWLSDATNNKCECADCRKLSISDWYAKVINTLSETLHRRTPNTRFVFLCYFELLWAPEQVAIDEQYGNAILMFAPIARCYGHALADPVCDDGQEWPRPSLNQYGASRHNAFYTRVLADWQQAFKGDSFVYDYHLMWAVWSQLTDTYLARLYHQDLQDFERLGLGGVVSCQSFRAFYPSGLAMAVLTESLWNPDETWDEMRRRYLQAAYGEHAEFAGAYLESVESYLDTGDPHWRTPPFSNADQAKLAEAAAFLDRSMSEVKARYEATDPADKTRRKSLDLLLHHVQFLQFIVRAYQARLAGKTEEADQAFDGAVDHLQQTEPEYSTYIDTMLAIRFVEQARRQG
ncbi:MAG: DUF4838 domain-containing protein [Anaerolineae bacterium]|nr:DUF4838 domain-containing protein [Anaerolineae bacterium]